MYKRQAFLAISLVLISGLTGCSTAPKTSDKASDKTNANQATSSTTSSTTGSTASTQQDKTAAAKGLVNIDQMPDTTVICTVENVPLTVGDYKRLFKLQQSQLQEAINSDPAAREKLVDQAHKLGLELTPEEKTKLVTAARQSQDLANADKFQQFLKDRQLTETQYNDQVYQFGLGLKVIDLSLRQSLLNDMVNRQIVLNAAKDKGFSKQANENYDKLKGSPEYDKLSKATGLSGSELKDILVQAEMVKLMSQQIQEHFQPSVSDLDMRRLYNANKQKLKHNERVHLAEIIVAAPTMDKQGVESVKSQIQKANPNLKGKELDDAVNMAISRQKEKALLILNKAMHGTSFAELANQYTDDLNAKKAHSGGDMGYMEKGQLVPELAKVIWPMKSGQILPTLVQTPLGFQIIKVLEHQGAGTVTFAEVKPILKSNVLQQKKQQGLSNWIVEKRKTVKVALSPQFSQMLSNNGSTGTNTNAGSTASTDANKPNAVSTNNNTVAK
jgi:parvulin-like peptidyl-prolyl isomerase